MSGNRARKVQPFTISTKLSLPKGSLDFPGDGASAAALDNRGLHENLNDSVTLYLGEASTMLSRGPFDNPSPVEEGVTNEDCINRNSLSRSIKKITLSNWQGETSPGEEGSLRDPCHASCERNCNNNNCRTGKVQFKVLLKKEVETEEPKQENRRPQTDGHSSLGRVAQLHMIGGCVAGAPWKENIKNTETSGVVGPKPCIQNFTGLAALSKWRSLASQFNCDMVQAENWVQAKLQDLKGGSSIQEWERMAQTLQRDMKDFENTMIKLSQMGEQLMVQTTSSAEIMRRLQTLREQWQLLKQMAEHQSNAVGGLRSLQEFNWKAEQLEAWIRQKEEKPLLDALLQENADKIQLTRRILDLKQEEQRFQALHEEVNSLAHKLEKQGKSESRSILARRKHLNKIWLRLQSTLKEHHETLQLALEAAAFLQQADVVLGNIHTKWRSLCGVGKQKEPTSNPDLDVRDIASQVMLLDVTMSQLTSLHPNLVARVSLKYQDVKDRWTQLQQMLRNEKPLYSALTRRSTDSPDLEPVMTTVTEAIGRKAGEKPVWEVRKNMPGNMAEPVRIQDGISGSPGKASIVSDSRRRRKFHRQSNGLKDPSHQESHSQDFCQELEQLLCADHTWSPQMEDALEEIEDLWAELKRRHQENGVALREIDTALRLVEELGEAERWLGTVIYLLSEATAAKNTYELHRDLEKIGTLENQVGAWNIKLQSMQEEMQMKSSDHTVAAVIQRKMSRVKEKLTCVQEVLQRRALDLHDSLILTEFLQNVRLEEVVSQKNPVEAVLNQQDSPKSLHHLIAEHAQLSREDISRPLEELQEAVQMLNNVVKEREKATGAMTKMENLKYFVQALTNGGETRLAWITSQMKTIRDKAETLTQDIIQAEKSFATVKSEQDLLELQDLLKRQKETESGMSELERDMEELEKTFHEVDECYFVQMSDEYKRVPEILDTWKDLQKLVLENAVHGQQAVRLRQFFRDYLAIISWTEDTRAWIFSETLSTQGLSQAQWEELENNMKTKFKEFEKLAIAGWELVAEEHYLSETLKERMEELQSMLGWVMVRWRAQQSFQKEPGSKTQNDALNVPEHCQIKKASDDGASETSHILGVSERPLLTTDSFQRDSPTQNEQEIGQASTAILSALDVPPLHKHNLNGSERQAPLEMDVAKETLVLAPSETPVLLLPQPCPGSLGGTVNLILNIGKTGENKTTVSQAGPSPSMGQETLHKVSTYLHVKEKDEERKGNVAHGSSSVQQPVKQVPPRAHLFSLPNTEWGTRAFHTLPKITSSFFLQSLKKEGRVGKGDLQELTFQGNVGPDTPQWQPVQKEKNRTSSTWPPKYKRKMQALQTQCPPHKEQFTVFQSKSSGEASEWHLRKRTLNTSLLPTSNINTCHHLSLGSVLSLEIPKDPTVLKNVKDAIWIAKENLAERKGVSQACQVAHGCTNEAVAQESNSLRKKACKSQSSVHQNPVRLGDAHSKFPQSKGSTRFEEVNISPDPSRQKASVIALCGESRQSPLSQSGASDDFLDFRQKRLSQISILHEQIGWEWDKLAASLSTSDRSSQVPAVFPTDSKVREASRVKLKPFPAKCANSSDVAFGTTEVKNPAVNETPEKESTHNSKEGFVRIPSLSLHQEIISSSKQSVSEGEPIHQKGTPVSSRHGSLVLTSEGDLNEGPKLPNMTEVCHPAHELFEEEEEELQAIWNNVEKHKRNSGVFGSPREKMENMQSPGSSDGKHILTSADNLLVAKFKLGPSAQLLKTSETEKISNSGLDRKKSPSQGWASVPFCQEPLKGAEDTPLRSPQGTCPLDQKKIQEEIRSVSKTLASKLEQQMMEGTLERKHLLQAGGRKANCRSWNTFHTVLMRQTLCFYQDRKDTLKSSVVVLPLNLCGAVCTLETEYTKKNNCFTLQLKDGSKYLLRAPSEPLMKEWITKLQQNSGSPEMDYFQSSPQTTQGTASSVRMIPSLSRFLGNKPKSQETVLLPRTSIRLQLPYDTQDDPTDSAASQTGNTHKSTALYTTEHSLRQGTSAESATHQDPCVFPEEDWGLVTNKRRSYSFTSATYQKITPLSVSKEPLGIGSSYSVTLYIGEQAPISPRPRCHSFIAMSGGARETMVERSQGASPRQKNKSVFRKLFGKRD